MVTTDFTRTHAAIYSRRLTGFFCSVRREEGLLCADSLGAAIKSNPQVNLGRVRTRMSGGLSSRPTPLAKPATPSRPYGYDPARKAALVVRRPPLRFGPAAATERRKALILRKDMLRLSSRARARPKRSAAGPKAPRSHKAP